VTLHSNDDTVTTIVGLNNIPEAIRSVDTFGCPDYADMFTVTTSTTDNTSAEEWARAVLEGTPTGRSAPLLWRLLGLRLGPRPSPDHVQGWRIADRGDDWIRLEATSWLMTGHAVVQVDGRQVSVALFVRYNRPLAALIWAPVSVMHRRGVPVMLHQALKAHGCQTDEDRSAAL
jgi:hypothetical protein